jgi:hypothetical protein
MRYEIPAGRDAAKAFWRTDVLREGRMRVKWPVFAALRRGKLEMSF